MQVREKPILVSGPLIGPIQRGTKTQTRRIVNPQPIIDQGWEEEPGWAFFWKGKEDGLLERDILKLCPHGQPGDRLWVREAHGIGKHAGEVIFKADGGWSEMQGFNKFALDKGRWIPSIHMKRVNSRIDLEITDLRIQRIQDISPEDAYAEGLGKITKDGNFFKFGMADRDGMPGNDNYGWPWDQWETDPVAAFRKLWDAINAERGFGWDTNPWVWAISFKKIRG